MADPKTRGPLFIGQPTIPQATQLMELIRTSPDSTESIFARAILASNNWVTPQVNQALAQLVEWIDALTGLRGTITLYDAIALSLPAYAFASLPVAGTAGRLARMTNNVRGVWMDQGSQWFGINGEILNVREFGATGDGVTDDTAAIAAAALALPAYGTLRFSTGRTYFIRGSAQIDITAEGATVDFNGARIIHGDSTTYGNFLFRAITGTHITFRNGVFDMSGWTTAGAGAYSFAVTFDSTSTYGTIENCWFKDSILYRLPSRSDGAYNIVRNSRFENTGGGAMLNGSYSSAYGNLVVNPVDAPFVINGIANVGSSIIGNTVYSTVTMDPAMIAIETGPTYWIVDGNNIYSTNAPPFIANQVGLSAPVSAHGRVSNNIFRTSDGGNVGSVQPNVRVDRWYGDIDFINNDIQGVTGSAAPGIVDIYMRNNTLRGNRIASSYASVTAAVRAQAVTEGGYLKLYDNDITSPGILVNFQAATFTGDTLYSGGNRFGTSTTGYALSGAAGITLAMRPDYFGTITTEITLPSSYTVKEMSARFLTPAFSAGNFTGNGSMTWTVASGDVTTYEYTVIGKTLLVNFYLVTTTVGGTPNTDLQIQIPGGFTSSKAAAVPFFYLNNGTRGVGRAYVQASDTLIHLEIAAGTAWAAATNTTDVYGQVGIEVQFAAPFFQIDWPIPTRNVTVRVDARMGGWRESV